MSNKMSETLTSIKMFSILLVVIGHVSAIYTPTSSYPHQLNMLLRHYIYFVIGYYVGNLDNIECDGIYSFISLVIGLLGNYLMFKLPKILFPIVSIITALSLSFFTYSICQKLSKHTKLYCCINKDGMGIYLFHVVIIYILFHYNLFAQLGIYAQALLITLISIFGSIIATRLIRSFKLGFLIGE